MFSLGGYRTVMLCSFRLRPFPFYCT